MWLILLFVLSGALLGLFIPSVKLRKAAATIQKYVVFVLIFLMGLGIGLDEQIISQAGKIGVGALVFALLAGALSALLTLGIDRLIRKRGSRL